MLKSLNSRLVVAIAAGALASQLGAGCAQATVLPVSSYSGNATAETGAGGDPYFDAQTVQQNAASNAPSGIPNTCENSSLPVGCFASIGTTNATAQVSAGRTDISAPPNPEVIANVSSSSQVLNDSLGRPLGGYGAFATSILTYSFEVAPLPLGLIGTGVSLDLAGSITLLSEGGGSASAFVTVSDPTGAQLYSDSASGEFDPTFIAITGTIYTIELYAQAQAFGGGTALAEVDPLLTLDPSLADDYTIIYSPDLIDSSSSTSPPTSVPEPASWLTFIAGIFGLWLVRDISARAARAERASF